MNWSDDETQQPIADGEIRYVDGTGFRFGQEGSIYTFQTSSSGGASLALDNLVGVAINTSLVSDADSTDDLGSSLIYWANSYVDRMYVNATSYVDGGTAGTFSIVGAADVSGALTVDLGSTLTGNVACGGDLDVDGTLTVGGFATDAVVAATAATTLTLDGTTSGGVNICSTSTGGITLGDDTTLATGKNFTIVNGAFGITAGSATLTDGDFVSAEGKITLDSTADDQSYIKRNVAATTGPLLELEDTNASADNETLLIDSNGTGAVGSVVIDHEGTADAITLTSLAAGASLIKATGEAATGTILEGISAASATVSALTLTDTGTGATGWLGADGVGIAQITCDGNLAHANASCMLIEYSGTGAATGLGTSLRIVDTGGTATSYAAYISAATGEALRVDAGNVLFDEDCDIGAACTVGTTLGVTGTTAVTGGIIGAVFHTGTGITATSGPGAVAVTGRIHEITTTGAGDAMTLANGTAGQRLTVLYVAEGAGADTAVMTPTTLAGGTTITFNALGDSCDLTYSATGGWYMTGGTATLA